MWNLPRLTSLFNELHSDAVSQPEVFEQEYTCYPVSFLDREELECGNKILLPQSALSILARMNVSWPMLFKVSNVAFSCETHCGVLEFSAGEGTCYMPYWMMRNLLLKEGDLVRVRNTSLPKGTYVKLQPVSHKFFEISDHRAVLEYTLRHFSAISVGDNIVIKHNDDLYEIEIVECRPARSISIIETDVQVDFSPPKDNFEHQTTNTLTTALPCVANDQNNINDKDQLSAIETYKDSSIQGSRIYGGVRISNPLYNKLSKNEKLPSNCRNPIDITATAIPNHGFAKFIPFSGNGNSLK